MSVLSISGTIQKGSSVTVIVNKNELKALISDGYFSDTAGWYQIIVSYVDSFDKNQFLMVSINGQLPSPTKQVTIPVQSKGHFRVYSIKLIDIFGGEITIFRDSIPEAKLGDFDVLPQIAPSSSIVSKSSNSIFTLESGKGSKFKVGYRVRAFDVVNEVFIGNAVEITGITLDQITVNNPISGLEANMVLKIALRDECNVEQQGKYAFVGTYISNA